MSEVENGGHYQYFLNMAHFDHDEVVRALGAIGATEHMAILSDALKTVRVNPLGAPQTVGKYLAGEKAADLSGYDKASASCKRSVFQSLQDYLDKYEGDFIEWTP